MVDATIAPESAALNPEIREITGPAQWHAWRREAITASRLPALFGCHPYMDRAALAAGLRGVDQADNAAMRAGRILEPGVAVALAEEHPCWRLVKATTFHIDATLRFGATPDYFLDDDGLVQIKTVSPEKWEEWRGRVPLAYQLQTLAELMLTGRTRGILAVMVRSRSYPVHEFDVPRHPVAEAKIIAAVREFWRAWDAGEIAAPAPADDLAAMLDDGSHRDLSGDNQIRELLEERELLKAAAGDAEKRLKEVEYEIKNRIGSARTAYLPGWQLSFQSQRRKETILQATNFRVLRIKRLEQ